MTKKQLDSETKVLWTPSSNISHAINALPRQMEKLFTEQSGTGSLM
ncbi:hypothetical protein A0J48_009055 [Sphaerospermopsis aphanizomenoides BCCUSP55]|nr:hypothetical protein [Sphaerospermopsis aphanizomenoides]MBK1987681.1 hypothetical protein [Sphaerospermopsis aphanizomenoides BCCUSP55]